MKRVPTRVITTKQVVSEIGKSRKNYGYWLDFKNHRKFFDEAADKLNLESLSDWYKVKMEQVERIGGGALLRHYYNDSLSNALSICYPEYNWMHWKFSKVPQGFWSNIENQKIFFKWISSIQTADYSQQHLSTEDKEQLFYYLSQKEVHDHGASSLLKHQFGGSIRRAITSLFPEVNWKMWKFGNAPSGFWKDIKNQRRYLDWLSDELGIQSYEKWYFISSSNLKDKGAHGVLSQYDHSIPKTLMSVYSEVNWIPWRFAQVSKNYWQDINNQREYFEWIANKLGLKELDDWYSVTAEDFEKEGRSILSRYYGRSIVRALQAVYPVEEHPWQIWRFVKVPKGYWNDESNVRDYTEWLYSSLRIEHVEHWNSITLEHVRARKADYLIRKSGGIAEFLTQYFPECPSIIADWSIAKTQLFLTKTVEEIFAKPQCNEITPI